MPLPTYRVVPENCPGGDKDGLIFKVEQEPRQSPEVQLQDGFLALQTSDPDDFGTLTVTFTLEPADLSTVSPISVVYAVELRRCRIDFVTVTTVITDFDYQVGSGDF